MIIGKTRDPSSDRKGLEVKLSIGTLGEIYPWLCRFNNNIPSVIPQVES